jgi:hypothetical protein
VIRWFRIQRSHVPTAARDDMAHMKRRNFIEMFGGVTAWPIAVRSPQASIPVIALLNDASSAEFVRQVAMTIATGGAGCVARAATSTIPIVFTARSNPVETGPASRPNHLAAIAATLWDSAQC